MSGSIKHPFFWKLHHLTDIFGAKYEQIKINHLEAYPFRAISRSNKNWWNTHMGPPPGALGSCSAWVSAAVPGHISAPGLTDLAISDGDHDEPSHLWGSLCKKGKFKVASQIHLFFLRSLSGMMWNVVVHSPPEHMNQSAECPPNEQFLQKDPIHCNTQLWSFILSI